MIELTNVPVRNLADLVREHDQLEGDLAYLRSRLKSEPSFLARRALHARIRAREERLSHVVKCIMRGTDR
jgi:hypothetical protein